MSINGVDFNRPIRARILFFIICNISNCSLINGKGGSKSEFGLDSNFSSHLLNKLFTDAEAQARASLVIALVLLES